MNFIYECIDVYNYNKNDQIGKSNTLKEHMP